MSNYLAVASVTAALRHRLQGPVQAVVPGAEVRTTRPDTLVADRTASGVNIFLYQVSPNAALRNADTPTRRADGSLLQRPRAAVDIFYLLSFFGADERLEPQRLLGITLSTLHAEPMLGPDQIGRAIAAAPGGTLLDSNLPQQLEAIKVTLQPMTTDELSRLWSMFFHVPYYLSVAYEVSALILDADLQPVPALPVHAVRFNGQPRLAPRLQRLSPETVYPGELAELHLYGQDLEGEDPSIVVDGLTSQAEIVAPGELLAPLPPGVRAGLKTVRVALRGPDGPRLSNSATFTLAPVVLGSVRAETVRDARSGRPVLVAGLQVSPTLGAGQQAALLLNEWQPPLDRAAGAFSSERLLRIEAPALPTTALDEGAASETLIETLRAHNITLSAGARVTRLDAQRWLIDDAERGTAYVARAAGERLVVDLAARPDDPEGYVRFELRGLPPARYLVRIQVDNVSSALSSGASGAFEAPLVEIA